MPRVRLAALIAVAGLAAGCRTVQWPAEVPARIELSGTPFYPQDAFQCGPAALATLLGASGAHAPPSDLVDEVYIPARKGSLQTEMLAAARQRHRIPYLLEPRFDALLAQLGDGRPVLVLLNLGVRSWPIWHYAVVIGYERDAGRKLLRSGTTARARMSLRRFLGAWDRADHWGFVALRPAELPRTATASRYAAAVADFERIDPHAALRAYEAGMARWPDEPLLRFGAANMLLAMGEPARAEEALRKLLRVAPAEVAARNNLAELLSQRGCRDAALAQIAVAGEHARGTALAAAVAATADEIAARTGDPAAACPREGTPRQDTPR